MLDRDLVIGGIGPSGIGARQRQRRDSFEQAAPDRNYDGNRGGDKG